MKVAIIHPWFPQYRAKFFEQLIAKGSDVGIDFVVFYGETPPEWSDRNDVVRREGFTKLPTLFIRFRGRTLIWKSLKLVRAASPYDLIIVEQAVRNIETYELVLRGAPLAFWGHGKTYTKHVSEGQESFKRWLTRRGKWFFAYTTGGVEALVRAGVPRKLTTVLQNSIDTTTLRGLVESVDVAKSARFNADHDLHGKTALFIGGLDESKRLPFLVQAAKLAHGLDSDFRLMIAGAGSDSLIAEEAARELSYVSYLGPLFGEEKALAIKSAQVIAMPGRVGLVAVDSFACGTPIITTDWPWHAPEFEYLESGINAVIAADNPHSYADSLVRILQDESGLLRLREACLEAADRYTVEAMVDNFVSGVKDALDLVKT